MSRLRYNGLATGSSGSTVGLTLGGSLTSGATSVTFSAALTYNNGTAVPTIVSPDYIPLTILDTNGNLSEIVYLTAYTAAATTGTITRGQEGTTGVAQASGNKIIQGPTVADVVNGSGPYEWKYYPWMDRAASGTIETRTAGTYAYTASSGVVGGGFIYNSSAAVNDTLDFYLWLGPGTYDLRVTGGQDSNRGITTWYLDDGAGTFTTLGTYDWVGASANDVGAGVTGFTVTGSVVRRTFRSKVTSKSVGSSSYFMSIQSIHIIRTA